MNHPMLSKNEQLKDRVSARKHELMSKLKDLSADGRQDGAKARDAIEAKLRDLDTMLKDGWDNVSDAVSEKLDRWLSN
jgi:hypothetical protein